MGVYSQYIAPGEAKEHLLPKASQLTSYALLTAEVESFVNAKSGDKSTATDTGASTKDGMSKGKGRGTDSTGKGGGGGWGTWGQGWNNGKQAAQAGGGTSWWKVANKGEAWAASYFAGYCHYCNRWGHKEPDCRLYKQKAGKAKAKGKDKQKGKGKGTPCSCVSGSFCFCFLPVLERKSK